MPVCRLHALLFVVPLVVVHVGALAQVRIHMATAQQADCIATTDGNGLQVLDGAADVFATGVMLSGDGCSVGMGESDDDYAIVISGPPSATVPATIDVRWSVSPNAARCMYGGTGATGWPSGAGACQGATCTGEHLARVTLTEAGIYDFELMCTNPSGYASGSVSAAAAPRGAQSPLRLRMRTVHQADCTATIDANGLQPIAGTPDFRATGVVLSGSGCIDATALRADYDTTITVPSTATVPSTIGVQWSATQEATRCMHGGSRANGWPVGSSACTGSECAGTHANPVTLDRAGVYTFDILCTNATGHASARVIAVPGDDDPPQDHFALIAPSNAIVGVPFVVSWNLAGATSCVGNASRDGNPEALPGWTYAGSPDSPRGVIATAAGVHVLTLTCSTAAGPITSLPASVAAVIAPGCLSEERRVSVASLSYPEVAGSPTRANVDVRYFDNLWGHANASDPVTPWPGVDGSTIGILNWNREKFVAARFDVPANAPPMFGQFQHAQYFVSPALLMAISPLCGDFGFEPACVQTVERGEALRWTIGASSPTACPLFPGVPYYFNVALADPATLACGTSGICPGIAIRHVVSIVDAIFSAGFDP